MPHKLYEIILSRIRDRKKIYEDSIIGGAMRSFEEYKHATGKILAVIEAENIVKSAFKDRFVRMDEHENGE